MHGGGRLQLPQSAMTACHQVLRSQPASGAVKDLWQDIHLS